MRDIVQQESVAFIVRVTAKTPAMRGNAENNINLHQQYVQPVASCASLLATPTQKNLFNTMTSHGLSVRVDTDRIVGLRLDGRGAAVSFSKSTTTFGHHLRSEKGRA